MKNSNATKATVQEMLNSSTTMILLNLTVGGSFTARVQAYTGKGYGPYSAPVPIVMDPAYPARAYSSTTNGEAWIIVLLAALVVMLACVIVTVVYLKRKQNAGKQLGHFNGKHATEESRHDHRRRKFSRGGETDFSKKKKKSPS